MLFGKVKKLRGVDRKFIRDVEIIEDYLGAEAIGRVRFGKLAFYYRDLGVHHHVPYDHIDRAFIRISECQPDDSPAYYYYRLILVHGNKEFANWIVQKCGGAIMEVRVELTRDNDTKSGYLWTTLLGPKEDIQEGMTCTATAIVDRKSPAAYAFDKLGQWLRTD